MQDDDSRESPLHLSQETKRDADASLDHATDLLDAARLLMPRFPHLAYHFATLSLEEVGRSTLLVMEEVAQRREAPSGGYRRGAGDHVRKLFWALWGPSFGRETITGAQIEEFRGLARHVHQTRQAGLYYGGVDARIPSEAISATEANELIELV